MSIAVSSCWFLSSRTQVLGGKEVTEPWEVSAAIGWWAGPVEDRGQGQAWPEVLERVGAGCIVIGL